MSRYYQDHKGRDVPSVTTVIGQLDKSEGLMKWAANQTALYILQQVGDGSELEATCYEAPNEYRNLSQAACDIGSEVHQRIEQYLWGHEYGGETSEAGNMAFASFLQWAEEYKPEPIKTEDRLITDRYAGTCDFYGYITVKGKKKKYVLDWKTSNYLGKDYSYQIAAYRQCYPDAEGCGILRIDKKQPSIWQWRDTSKTYEDDKEVFNTLVKLWWQTHPNKSKDYDKKTKEKE
jgi:hypothetical protein